MCGCHCMPFAHPCCGYNEGGTRLQSPIMIQILTRCPDAQDFYCDDGGPSVWSSWLILYQFCPLGHDCDDCGPRDVMLASYPGPSPRPPLQWPPQWPPWTPDPSPPPPIRPYPPMLPPDWYMPCTIEPCKVACSDDCSAATAMDDSFIHNATMQRCAALEDDTEACERKKDRGKCKEAEVAAKCPFTCNPDSCLKMSFSGDGVCDDGGDDGGVTRICPLGHDCRDCGPRQVNIAHSPPPLPPNPPNLPPNYYEECTIEPCIAVCTDDCLPPFPLNETTRGVRCHDKMSLKQCLKKQSKGKCNNTKVGQIVCPATCGSCKADEPSYIQDGICDDGASVKSGTQFSAVCSIGSDCSDCGVRHVQLAVPSPPPAPPAPPAEPPEPPSIPPGPVLPCLDYCEGLPYPWSDKCFWAGCTGCGSCFIPPPVPPAVPRLPPLSPPTTPPSPSPPPPCLSYCEGLPYEWSEKCFWAGCTGCGYCDDVVKPPPPSPPPYCRTALAAECTLTELQASQHCVCRYEWSLDGLSASECPIRTRLQCAEDQSPLNEYQG